MRGAGSVPSVRDSHRQRRSEAEAESTGLRGCRAGARRSGPAAGVWAAGALAPVVPRCRVRLT